MDTNEAIDFLETNADYFNPKRAEAIAQLRHDAKALEELKNTNGLEEIKLIGIDPKESYLVGIGFHPYLSRKIRVEYIEDIKKALAGAGIKNAVLYNIEYSGLYPTKTTCSMKELVKELQELEQTARNAIESGELDDATRKANEICLETIQKVYHIITELPEEPTID